MIGLEPTLKAFGNIPVAPGPVGPVADAESNAIRSRSIDGKADSSSLIARDSSGVRSFSALMPVTFAKSRNPSSRFAQTKQCKRGMKMFQFIVQECVE